MKKPLRPVLTSILWLLPAIALLRVGETHSSAAEVPAGRERLLKKAGFTKGRGFIVTFS